MPESVAVIGAGVMGSGIAQVCALGGHRVTCVDLDRSALDRARREIVDGRFGLRSAVDRGRATSADADAARALIDFTSTLANAGGAELVIEAIPEVLASKVRLFRALDGLCPTETVLATNSSGLPVAAMASATDRPDRVVGWHWSSPAPVMRFAEVVRTADTSDATIDRVTTMAERLGKRPVVVWDEPKAWGYVANRIYFAAVAEAQRVVDDGVATAEQVDQLLVDCYRWPVGPFAMVRGANEGWR